jgi:hypothetical protein
MHGSDKKTHTEQDSAIAAKAFAKYLNYQIIYEVNQVWCMLQQKTAGLL